MSQLNKEQINFIASEVVNLLKTDRPAEQGHDMIKIALPEVHVSGASIYHDLDGAVQAAKAAQQSLMNLSLEKRNEIILSIRKKMLLHAEDLATRAHEETGLGRKEDKIIKNRLVTKKTPGTEFLTPSAQSGDRGLTLTELAPYGVIGAITPVTNPTSTIICNSIGMLAAGNAIVFNVHPS
ncbi:MAG: aldehyde dehydrogenase family protein, partial [Planctomycetota bacterium]